MTQEYILGVKVDFGMSKSEVLEKILECVKNNTSEIICTTNSEFVVDAQKDMEFREIINGSFMSLPDSSGVVQAQKYLNEVKKIKKDTFFPLRTLLLGIKVGIFSFFDKTYIENTLSGSDLVYDVCDFASKKNLNVFLLGGSYRNSTIKTDMSQDTRKILSNLYPTLKIVGATSRFLAEEIDDEQTLNYIHECMRNAGVERIDILLVAYGHPKQEKWLKRNINKIPSCISIGVGGTFDYVTSFVKRPPKFVINIHMEWLYRLINQPFRFKRVMKAFPLFPWLVYKSIDKCTY